MIMMTVQPKQIMEIKDFLLTARRQDAKCKCARYMIKFVFLKLSWHHTKDCTVPMMTRVWLIKCESTVN